MNNEVKITRVRAATSSLPALYLVTQGSRDLGLLEKRNSTRSAIHPWKAYQGVGASCRYLGSHYGSNGKRDALAQLLSAAGVDLSIARQ
jgi:hypothetical protein